MKKIILSLIAFWGFGLLCANDIMAQSSAKTPGNKLPAASQTAVTSEKPSSNPRIHARGAGPTAGARKCTPIRRDNPFAISRKDFEKLPADRQRFLLDNPSKYTIID